MIAVQRKVNWQTVVIAFAATMIVMLSGCSIQLAPNYEQTIVDSLNTYNENLIEHFASVKEGTVPGLSKEQAAAYDSLEAKGNALLMLVEARPEPKPAFLRMLGISSADDVADDGDISATNPLDVPTDDQVQRIMEQIQQMRNSDETQGLNPREVVSFRNSTESFMRNAITYELALKR